MNRLPAQPIKGLIDGLSVLQELSVSNEPLATRQVADKLQLEITRVNRLLKTLAYLGLALQVKSRKYTTGPGIHLLAAQTLNASGLLQNALPYLEKLQQHQMTVALGVLWNDQVSYLYHWQPEMTSLEAIGRMVYPALDSSIGRMLLAYCEDEQVRQMLHAHDPRQVNSLMQTLEGIRVNGHALVERTDEKSLAVSVGRASQVGLALSGKMTDADLPQYLDILSKTAEQIATSFNYPT